MLKASHNLLENGDVAARLRAAFPRRLAVDVDAALAVIPVARHLPSADDIGSIVVEREALYIPGRIYSAEPEPAAAGRLSDISGNILSCLFTRHHDGFVREKHVRQLLVSEDAWVPPYVLQLVGEYVVEIVELLWQEVDRLRNNRYSSFAAANEGFIRCIRHRVISYWDCYYRSRYSRFSDYPGYQVMSALALWDDYDARRELAR